MSLENKNLATHIAKRFLKQKLSSLRFLGYSVETSVCVTVTVVIMEIGMRLL